MPLSIVINTRDSSCTRTINRASSNPVALIDHRHCVMTERPQVIRDFRWQVLVNLEIHRPDTGSRLSSRARIGGVSQGRLNMLLL